MRRRNTEIGKWTRILPRSPAYLERVYRHLTDAHTNRRRSARIRFRVREERLYIAPTCLNTYIETYTMRMQSVSPPPQVYIVCRFSFLTRRLAICNFYNLFFMLSWWTLQINLFFESLRLLLIFLRSNVVVPTTFKQLKTLKDFN